MVIDVGTGQITKQQKDIINKFMPDFVKSTVAKQPTVGIALAEMKQKLEEKKIQLRYSMLKAGGMTANPTFQPPSALDLPPPPITKSAGGKARKYIY